MAPLRRRNGSGPLQHSLLHLYLLESTADLRICTRRLLDILEDWAPWRHTHCIPWVNYCSYGQLSKPSGRVVDNFLQLEVSPAATCFTSIAIACQRHKPTYRCGNVLLVECQFLCGHGKCRQVKFHAFIGTSVSPNRKQRGELQTRRHTGRVV